MTIVEIMDRVKHIREIAGDDEAAHAAEDRLFHDFCAYLASPRSLNDGHISVKASLVMQVVEIEFNRWCA